MKKKKKTFNVVKQVKRLSRSALKPPQTKRIQPKKQKLLEKLIQQEIQQSLTEF